jgi:two-component system nitrogen regulation response regulator GlnG
MAINCAAIPENLIESELFGHERGAFTGAAQQRIGKFEQCNGGTLFLDEIGDMPLSAQTRMLRVLQNGTFERVGGNETVKVDVRIIAATNKPLEQAVAARTFREDLFYRLNVVRIQLPPLRERRGDIALLIPYFLRRFAAETGRAPKVIVPDAMHALVAHRWPGNVRELENALRRACVVASGDTILPRDLPPEVAATFSPETTAPQIARGAIPQEESGAHISAIAQTLFRWAREQREFKVLPAVERELVIEAMKETGGNQVQAARLLGITRATLRKRIDKFKIRKELVIQ